MIFLIVLVIIFALYQTENPRFWTIVGSAGFAYLCFAAGIELYPTARAHPELLHISVLSYGTFFLGGIFSIIFITNVRDKINDMPIPNN